MKQFELMKWYPAKYLRFVFPMAATKPQVNVPHPSAAH
jgi:hypothetical protein